MTTTEVFAGPSTPSPSVKTIHQILNTIDPSTFDWQAFEGTYKDRALITRLLHVATIILNNPQPTNQSLTLAKSALTRLLPLIKSTLDVATYTKIFDGFSKIAQESNALLRNGNVSKEEMGEMDTDWLEDTTETARKEGARLEVELRGYISNLIKESIRLTYFASAQLSCREGNYAEVMRNYSHAREYSSGPSHLVDLGVGILQASLAFNVPTSLPGQISKLEASLDRAYPVGTGPKTDSSTTAADIRQTRERETRNASLRKSVTTKIGVARGLVALTTKDFEKAGRELGNVIEEGGLVEWEGQAISTIDMAMIVALCTVATGGRDRIRRVLLDRTSFRSAVDDGIRWVLDLVRSFLEADYGQVLAILEKNEAHILLNPFLSQHTTNLIFLIRTRAIIQYVAPFSSVSMATMAAAFNMTQDEMLKEVEVLVEQGKIAGRIDLIDKILTMKKAEPRNELFETALRAGKITSETTRAALIRMRLHEARINVDPRPLDEQGSSGAPTHLLRGFNPSSGMELPAIESGEMDVEEILAVS